jgi:hypothetical protein
VVELVDASDSKSEEPCACGGSSPPSGTIISIDVLYDSIHTRRVSSFIIKGSNPPSESFDVWNSGGGTLTYTLAADQSWISLTPPGGTSTSTGGGSGLSTITVNYTASSLAAGTVTAYITISAPGASNSPQTIPVHVSVKSEAGGGRGGGGGGCFIISTSTEDDSGIQGIPFIVLVGMGFWGMILLTPRDSGNRYRG